MRAYELTEKKRRKQDYSPEEWAQRKYQNQSKDLLHRMISKHVISAIKILKSKNHEINTHYATSIAKRMALGMFDLINSDNNDKARIHKQVSGAISNAAGDHPDYGDIASSKDLFADILTDIVANNFETYKQSIEQFK